MGPILFRAFLALCLCASVYDSVHCSEQPFVQPSIHRHFSRKHFLKRRIPYNPNGTASFQLELLYAGDIHPNPGPDSQDREPLPPSARRHVQQRITFSPDELLQWRHSKGLLPQDISDVIQSYGINRQKARRGCRGGRRKNIKHNFVLSMYHQYVTKLHSSMILFIPPMRT